MRRTVPLSFAIATGLLGTIVGLALGIVITITRPDGSKISIDVPEGSDIDIRPSVAAAGPSPDGASAENAGMMGAAGMMGGMMGSMGMEGMTGAGVSQSTDAVYETPGSPDRPDPLRFAVLHDRESLSDEALEAAKGRLQRSTSGGAVMCDVGYWYPVTYGVNVPIEATKDRRRFTLAKYGLANEITWEELQNQVGISFDTRVDLAGNRDRGINLTFKDALPDRMRILTRRNVGSHFAVIVNGRVMSAPKIRSEITDAALLTGNFSASDILSLSEALGMTVDRSEMVPVLELERAADPAPPSTGDPDQAPIRKQLFAIGLGFHHYLDTYRRLPGSKNLTVSDFPHSWRVAILPMIGEAELYSQYRLDEPWDSEHNLTLLPKMPAIYRSEASESGPATPEGETHLQGFVGPRTALGDASGVEMVKITDGTSNTLLVIESLATVPWTKPDDIPFNAPEDVGQIKPFAGRPLHFVMADGAVRTMADIDTQKLNLMIIRDDGIPVELD
jgi:hypothetical protein